MNMLINCLLLLAAAGFAYSAEIEVAATPDQITEHKNSWLAKNNLDDFNWLIEKGKAKTIVEVKELLGEPLELLNSEEKTGLVFMKINTELKHYYHLVVWANKDGIVIGKTVKGMM